MTNPLPTTTTHTQTARAVIQALLHGGPPDETPPSACGGWAETVQALQTAAASGGPPAVRQLFAVLARAHPDLTKLLASQPGSPDPTAEHWHPAWRLRPGQHLQTLPPVRYLIDEVLPQNDLITLYGDSGTGKSFLALDLALTVAQVAPVVYVMAEALETYQTRTRAWCQHHQRDLGQFFFVDSAVDLSNPTEIGTLVSTIETVLPTQPALIVIDTLAPCFGDLDENSTRDMNTITRHLHRLRQAFGCSVLAVHHTGRSGRHERGSVVLRGQCAVMLEVTNNDGLITLRCDKQRHGTPFGPRHFRLVTVDLAAPGEVGLPIRSAVLLPASRVDLRDAPLSERQLQVLDAFRLETLPREGPRFCDLVDATEIPKSTMNGVLSALIRRGFVQRIDGVRPTYRLSDSGQAELATRDAAAEAQTVPVPDPHDPTRTRLNWQVSVGATSERAFGGGSAGAAHPGAVFVPCSGDVRDRSEPDVPVRSGGSPPERGNPEPNDRTNADRNRLGRSHGQTPPDTGRSGILPHTDGEFGSRSGGVRAMFGRPTEAEPTPEPPAPAHQNGYAPPEPGPTGPFTACAPDPNTTRTSGRSPSRNGSSPDPNASDERTIDDDAVRQTFEQAAAWLQQGQSDAQVRTLLQPLTGPTRQRAQIGIEWLIQTRRHGSPSLDEALHLLRDAGDPPGATP